MIRNAFAFAVAVQFLVSFARAGDLPVLGDRLIDEPFDDLRTKVWCPCQINLEGQSKLEFGEEVGSKFAMIPVLPSDIGGNACRWKVECKPLIAAEIAALQTLSPQSFTAEGGMIFDRPELPENLGPSLILPLEPLSLTAPSGAGAEAPLDQGEAVTIRPEPYPEGGPYCTDELRKEGVLKGEDVTTPCAQRQELRLQDVNLHPFSKPLLYSIRFRMEKDVPDEKRSVRWVIGQWKQEPAAQPGGSTGTDWSPSPIVAQRFDNGILHVTVQDKECRCVIASADGPDLPPWSETPQRCLSTAEGAGDEEACSAPPDLRAVYNAENPLLPSPRDAWVTLKYLIKPGKNGSGMVQVFDDDRLVVTVTGSIGYDEIANDPSFIKFKIGQYNDYLPASHRMDIDRVTIDALENNNLP